MATNIWVDLGPDNSGGGGGGGGITSINGLSVAAQFIVSGTSGSDFNISSVVNTHTINLPTASASVTGKLSSTDWSTFNSKQNALTIGNITDVGTDGIIISGGTGAIIGSGVSLAQHVADSTHNGYLSSVDWSTFNSKQAALTFGNLTDVGTDGITITGGTGAVIGSGAAISQHVADSTHNGYLSSTDWSTFNAKQASGNYITALTGDVTATGPGSVAATLAASIAGTHSFTGDISIKDLSITGTGGAGFISYAPQSSSPSAPASGFKSFSDNTNRPTWENTSGMLTTFDNTGITGNRVYTLRDVSGKFVLDSRWSAAATTLTTGTTSILSTDAFAVYLLDTSGGVITINLPTATSVADRVYIFKGTTGTMSTNNVTVVPNGTDTIEGLNVNKIFSTNFGSWTLVSDGVSAWWMV